LGNNVAVEHGVTFAVLTQVRREPSRIARAIPMFSIVIPLWNKRHTVAATVASALAQTCRDFELIIVDDGSTDDGMDRLEAFDDPRISRLRQQNVGPGGARNRGIEAARHDWIAFLDADDIWLPHHLAELDRIRLVSPEAGLIGTAFSMSAHCETFRVPPSARPRTDPVNFFEGAAKGAPPFCMSSSAIPRSTFARHGGFGPDLQGQDYEYFARIALDRPVIASNLVTTLYRLNTGGISDTTAEKRLGQIATLRDLGPSVALVVDSYSTLECPQMRRAVDRYIESQYIAWIRKSARIGDFRALRMLPSIRPQPAKLTERLILLVALFPPPLARSIFALALRLSRMFRTFSAGVR
jgi:glycosyltransferase involved in cell wall biosynthesis